MRLLLAALLLLNAAAATALEISLALDSIRHPAFAAERVRVQHASGGALLTIGSLRVGERVWRDLQFKCLDLALENGDLLCRGGTLKVGAGDTAQIDFHYVSSRKTLDLTLRDAPLASFAKLWPELAPWQHKGSLKGKLSGRVRLAADRADVDLTLAGAAFANAAGTEAGEGVALGLTGQMQASGGGWKWQLNSAWQGGEVYWAPWYAKAEGQRLEARGSLDAESVRLDAARLVLPRVGVLDAQALWDRRGAHLDSLTLASDSWQAAAAWSVFGQPLLGETPRVQADGTVRFALAADAAGVRTLDLDFKLARVDVADGRFSLSDFTAKLPWRRNEATQANVTVGAAQAGEVHLGAFAIPLAMEGQRFSFDRVTVPLLGSELLFEDFFLRRSGENWNWRLAAALHPVAMADLTRALKLPLMEGKLSATLPRMRYRKGTLSLDGNLIVSVFDGYLAVEGLRVIEPFGRTPSVAANVKAQHLDLAQLTQTFSFGNITGFIDAEVRGLEMAGWQPVAFDARVITSAGDFPKRISRRAVRNISAIGGGAAAGAAVEASVVGFFDTFGYERLGLRCHLLAGVCLMGGLDDTEHGYLIVQGGGLPSLNVMGYNRRVGWDVFVSRLRDVAAGNSKPVFE